jgi:F-type H+-transporting ATPase subunit delta
MRYANALFQLGRDQEGLLDRLYDDCSSLLKTLKDSDELVSFLKNPVVKVDVKKSFIEKTFKPYLQEPTLKFLLLIIENKREVLLRIILMDFMELYRNNKGIKRAMVTTAVPIDESFKTKIRNLVGTQLNGQVELDCKIDESIIGGLILMIDGKQADGSIAGKLRAMKQKMMLK